MQTGSCFICGEMISYNSCPLCYKCAQAYKRAVVECISDLKKEDSRIDNMIIAHRLANNKYARIIGDYLSTDRLANTYNVVIPRDKMDKALRYLYNTDRTSSIINELLSKGILMINQNGDFEEVSEDNIEALRKENSKNAGKQIFREELVGMKKKLNDTVDKSREEKIKNLGNGMFTNKYGR